MKVYKILCLGLLVALSVPSLASANKIQDTKAAARHFENELNFTTNPHGINALITAKEKNATATIIDLRREEDFKAGHIPGAINLPFDKWDGFKGSQTQFPGLRKDGINHVYCYELLCNLGQVAAKKFASLGYPVKEIKGGFKSWKEGEYPIEK